jgi:predicted DNA-binding transcriptional regulator YafY
MDYELEEIAQLICRAIADRKIIQFWYKDKQRIVEPYLCGITSAGHYNLRAFFIGGESETAFEPDWRMFRLDEMSMLQITEETFEGFEGKRMYYNPNDKAFIDIFCYIPRP